MAIILLLITSLSVVSGSNPDGWREELERRLSMVEESNAHLRNENEKLNSIVLNIQRENREIKRDLGELKEQLNNCELVSDTGAMTGDSQQEEVAGSLPERPTRRIHHEKNQPVSRIIPPDTYPISAVAFYAYLSKSSPPNLSFHHLIVYDVIKINRGNAYNGGDGIFIAPVTGVYAFHISVCVIEGREVPWTSLEITVNGNIIGSIFEEGQATTGGYHCSGTLVLSDVNAGDHVFVRTAEATRGPTHSDYRGRTSFSGWLLYR